MASTSVQELVTRRRRFNDLFHKFLLNPKGWSECTLPIALDWVCLPEKFDSSGVEKLPNDKAGVYCFTLIHEPCLLPFTSFVLYVGETSRNFRVRAKEYLRDAENEDSRPHIQDMMVDWQDHLVYFYAEIADPQQIEKVEDALIETFRPPFNPKLRARKKTKDKAKWTTNP